MVTIQKKGKIQQPKKEAREYAGVTINPDKQVRELHSACKDFINTTKSQNESATKYGTIPYGLNTYKSCKVLKKDSINSETRKLDQVAKAAFISKLIEKRTDIIGDIGNSGLIESRYLTLLEQGLQKVSKTWLLGLPG